MTNPKRVRKINNKENLNQGPVLYWMDREMRVNDNWSLLFALEKAKKESSNIVVIYNLISDFLGGNLRQLDFKIKSLKELKKNFRALNIPFFVLSKKDTLSEIEEFIEKNKIKEVITDFSPLKIQLNWHKEIAKKINAPFYEVDSHNIIPVWEASPKQEFAAHTLRSKIKRKLHEFTEEFPKVKKLPDQNLKVKYKVTDTDLDSFYKKIKPLPESTVVNWITPGEEAALKTLKEFLNSKIEKYAEKRNSPELNYQSNLSPYLHYGQISSLRILLEVLKKENIKIEELKNIIPTPKMGLGIKKLSTSADAFLEELIVRKELSDNYCFYNSNYDSWKGFPDWALETLNIASKDKREFIYSLKDFEFAKTHDDLWNAAQIEMLKTGKMHGYMRMYWAKKILEWTKDYKTAHKIAVYLNDKYELDGRDPNGYVGINWSIGGLHDRAWFKRPIFGKIRYMAYSGLKKKFDTKKYIEKVNNL